MVETLSQPHYGRRAVSAIAHYGRGLVKGVAVRTPVFDRRARKGREPCGLHAWRRSPQGVASLDWGRKAIKPCVCTDFARPQAHYGRGLVKGRCCPAVGRAVSCPASISFRIFPPKYTQPLFFYINPK